jgi:hypothetical protein
LRRSDPSPSPTSWVGARTGCDALVDLAETLALPVVDPEGECWKTALNFPTRHPLNLSGAQAELVAEADLLLGLEVRDLFGAVSHVDTERSAPIPLVPPLGRVAHVSLANQITRSWAADFQRLAPVDLHIPAERGVAVPAVLARVRELMAAGLHDEDVIEERRRRHSDRSRQLLDAWRREATTAPPSAGPLPRAHVAHVLDEVTAGHDRVLANGHLGTGRCGCGTSIGQTNISAARVAGDWATAPARRWEQRWLIAKPVAS